MFQQSRPEGTFLENVSSLLFINVTLVAGRHGPPTVLDRPHTHTHRHKHGVSHGVCPCKLEGKHAISAVKGDLLPQRSELRV